ncbi:MAG: hypothetical protein KUG79_13535 [Pseudomonadales bacterium]|nr:hypothetical protein [Pseudomonadales bacterium]
MNAPTKPQLFIYLDSENAGLHFEPDHFTGFTANHPDFELVFLHNDEALVSALPQIKYLDTWHFYSDWFHQAPRLTTIFTPAAGKNWIQSDPNGVVPVHYGTFHGRMIAEVMLGQILHFNRKMPLMLSLQQQKTWDPNAQKDCTLLCNQTALIIGYGNIGKSCGAMLTNMGMKVLGHQRQFHSGYDQNTGVQYVHHDDLDAALALADHTIILLPGDPSTKHFMSHERLKKIKPGTFLYNYGRGTTINENDLLWALDNNLLAGAGIDVTETEPLEHSAKLWHHPKVLLTPHSSCVYAEYQQLHVQELAQLFRTLKLR